MLSTARQRQELLASMIEEDPGEVLRAIVPASSRNEMPPEVQDLVEQQREVEGELQVIYEDAPPVSRLRYFLEAGEKRFSLHFAADSPKTSASRSRIRVEGIDIAGALALSSGTSSVVTVSPASSPNTFGAQNVAVI